MIGVSPAYFLSKYGEDFSPVEVQSEVPILKNQGFDAFQLEITKHNYLNYWNDENLTKITGICIHEDIAVSQVVAHYLIDVFSTHDSLQKGLSKEEIERLLHIVTVLPGCGQLTIPMGRFYPDESTILDRKRYQESIEQTRSILLQLCDSAQSYHVVIGLELQPGAIIQGALGFLQMLRSLDNHPAFCYNFDTGHVHATKDIVELIPVQLGDRIVGTHLCDNASYENLSLVPGEGTIPWESVFKGLRQTQYNGSYDLEILCKPTEVECKYTKGLNYILHFLS